MGFIWFHEILEWDKVSWDAQPNMCSWAASKVCHPCLAKTPRRIIKIHREFLWREIPLCREAVQCPKILSNLDKTSSPRSLRSFHMQGTSLYEFVVNWSKLNCLELSRCSSMNGVQLIFCHQTSYPSYVAPSQPAILQQILQVISCGAQISSTQQLDKGLRRLDLIVPGIYSGFLGFRAHVLLALKGTLFEVGNLWVKKRVPMRFDSPTVPMERPRSSPPIHRYGNELPQLPWRIEA